MTTEQIKGHVVEQHSYEKYDDHLVVHPAKMKPSAATSEDYVEYFDWGYRNKMGTGDDSAYIIQGSPLKNKLKTTSAIPREFIKDHGKLDLAGPVDQHTSTAYSSINERVTAERTRAPQWTDAHADGPRQGGNGQGANPSDMWEDNGRAGGFQPAGGAYSDEEPMTGTNPLAPQAYNDHDPAPALQSGTNAPAQNPMHGAFAPPHGMSAYDDDNGFGDAGSNSPNPLMGDQNDAVDGAQVGDEHSRFAYKPQPTTRDVFTFQAMKTFVDNMQSDRETGNLREIGADKDDMADRQKMRAEIARRSAHRMNAKNRRLTPGQIAMERNGVQPDSVVSRLNSKLARDNIRSRREFFDTRFNQMGYRDKTGDMTRAFEEGMTKNKQARAGTTERVADARLGLKEVWDLWKNRDDLKTPGPEETGRLALEMAFLKATGHQAQMNTAEVAQRQHAAQAEKQSLSDDADQDIYSEAGNNDDNAPRAAFGLKDQDRRAGYRERVADAFDDQEERIDEMQVLSDEAIEKGVEDLRYFMNDKNASLPSDLEWEYHALHAMSSDKRVVDGHQFSEQEIATTVDQFKRACKDHNAQVRAKNDARAERRNRNAGSSFPELKMSLETQEAARRQAAVDFAVEEVKDKHFWAGFAVVKIAAWMFQKTNWSWVKDARASLDDKKRELEQLSEHYTKTNFDDENLQEIKSQNFELARNWMMERYDYDKHVVHPDPERPNAHLSAETLTQQDLFDPEHFFAAMAEYADKPQEFVDELRSQVADSLGVDLKKKQFDTQEEREETLKMRQLVNAVTEGVYEGIMSAATERGRDQLGIRAEATKTHNADHYVQITGAHCAMTSDTAWNDVNFALNNVYDAELRDSQIGAHQNYANSTLAKIENDLNDSWATDGVFEGPGGARFAEKTQIIHLPIGTAEDAPRRAIVRHNLDVTKAETAAAHKTVNAVNGVIGAPGRPNTIASASANLDKLINPGAGAVDANNPFSTAPSREESFDAVRKEIEHVKERVSDLISHGYEVDINGEQVSGLKDHQIQALNQMVKDLEFRANVQERLHDCVAEYNDTLALATSPEDLDRSQPVGAKLDELEMEMEDIARRMRDVAETSKVADPIVTDRQLNKTLQEVKASKTAIVQIHGEYKAAKAALADLDARVRENAISREDAMRQGAGITRNFEKILQNRRAEVSGYSDKLATQFDGMGKEMAAAHDQLFATVCNIDTGGKAFSPEASNAIRQMEDAHVLDARTIGALQTMFAQQKHKGASAIASGQVESGSRDFRMIDAQLSSFGGNFGTRDAQFALADTTAQLFPSNRDAQLRFKRNLNTAAGQRGISNDELKFQHYAMDIRYRVTDREVALDQAAEFYDPKPEAAAKSAHIGTSFIQADDFMEIHTDDEEDDGVASIASDDEAGAIEFGIDPFVANAKRFEGHPLVEQRNKIEAAGGDANGNWFADGLDAIKVLYEHGRRSHHNHRLAVSHERQPIPLTGAQMENANAVMELLEALPSTEEDVQETQRQMAKEKVGFTQQNLKLALGFDPEAQMDDTQAVSDQITSVITNNANEKAIKDLQASHQDAMGLLQTQTEVATTVRAALVEPLKDFAAHLQNENVDTGNPDAVAKYVQSDKFARKRETLRNVAAIVDLDDRRSQNLMNASGSVSSDRYVSAGKQMVELSQHVRNFDPKSMKADRKHWADFKEWLLPQRQDPNALPALSEEEDHEEAIERVKAGDAASVKDGLTQMQAEQKAESLAVDLRWNGGEEIANKFAKVESHLNMLGFLEESNADIREFMGDLSTQYDGLLNDVQTLQKDRAVQLAILESLDPENPVLDDEAVQRAKGTLASWGQAAAWQGFEERHEEALDLMREGGSAQDQVLDAWRENAKGLPQEIQDRMTVLNDAIMRYEALLKETGNSICSLTDSTDFAQAKAKIAPTTNGILQERIEDRGRASDQFTAFFVNPHGHGRNETDALSSRPWADQAQWREAGGPRMRELAGMNARQFLPRLYNTMAAVGDRLTDLQTRYKDQNVQNAIVDALDKDNPTFDDATIERAKALLNKSGQADNWDGFARRHGAEMREMREGGASQETVLQSWRDDAKTLDPAKYSDEDIASDKAWTATNVAMLRKMEELDGLVHETKVKKDLFGWEPNQATKDRIQTLTNELKADRDRLNPAIREGRAHRYQHVSVGRAHGYWRQRRNANATFLNQMDNALEHAVTRQISNVPAALLN